MREMLALFGDLADGGEQGFGFVWLLEKGDGSQVIGPLAEVRALAGSQENDGHGVGDIGLDSFGDGKTITGRQGNIQNDCVRPGFDGGADAGETIVGNGGFKSRSADA